MLDSQAEHALELLRGAEQEEERRRVTLDTKASTLVAALAVSVTFALGAAGFLVQAAGQLGIALRIVLVSAYLVVLLSLAFALISAVRALWVRYQWAIPDPEAVFTLHGKVALSLKKELVAALLVSWRRNSANNDKRADAIAAGQGLIVVAALAIALVGIVLALAIGLGVLRPAA